MLQTLVYFERFSYPLTAEEVFQFSASAGFTQESMTHALHEMVHKKQVFQYGDFFQTLEQPEWPRQRLENNRRAEHYLSIARRMARLIAAFPFVRAVMVSGSLSKHSMRADGDIDFFVVTAPGRLWLARTMLVCFKKLFLLNSRKYFCVNYFVDTEHLEIEEKNLFTATEVVTLLPMYGKELFLRFVKANHWAWTSFPNFPMRDTCETPALHLPWPKRALEYLLYGRLGKWLDRLCMRLTLAYWQKKFKHMPKETFELAFKSKPYVSKHHPLHFQAQVLESLEERLKELEGR